MARLGGTLAFHPADELRETFSQPGEAIASGTVLAAPDGYRDVLTATDDPSSFRLHARLDIAEGTTEAGVLLRASADGDEGYVLRLEPKRGRFVFDRWPRQSTGTEQWQISGDVPFAVELERPCRLDAGEHEFEVIVDGDLCVATVDNGTVLSTRLYDRPSGRVGVFVGEGAVTVAEFSVIARDESEPETSAPETTALDAADDLVTATA